MTRNEVVRGLAIHARGENCDGCPYKDVEHGEMCVELLCLDAISLIAKENSDE